MESWRPNAAGLLFVTRTGTPWDANLLLNWRFESLAGYDLATLNWLPDFDALALWRLLDSREAVIGSSPASVAVTARPYPQVTSKVMPPKNPQVSPVIAEACCRLE